MNPKTLSDVQAGFAGRPSRSDFADVIFRELRASVPDSTRRICPVPTGCNAMENVFSLSDPFEIVGPIVRAVAVLVIDDTSIRTKANESFRHEDMNASADLSAIACERHRKIPSPPCLRENVLARRFKTSDLAKVGYLVLPARESAGDRAPLF